MTTPNIADSVTNTPTGPSGVRGLGDTFAADPHSGTGRFTIPFALPAGHAGLSPSLALVYSTGAGAGVAGAGWSFGISSIRRRTDKGIPAYAESDTFVLGSDELIPVGNGRYVRRQEGSFARIVRVRERGEDFWAVTTRGGTRHLYGRDPAARHGDGRRTSAWLLSETRDPHGNTITYGYTRDEAGQRTYLSQIDWGNGAWRALIAYEARPDVLHSGRTGLTERTDRRLARVEVQVKRSDTGQYFTIDRYTLGYAQSAVTGLSLLESVERTGIGADGSEAGWPRLTFGYTSPGRRAKPIRVSGAPARTLADPDLQLVDLDGNALPDLLVSDDAGYALWRNDGEGGFERPQRIRGPNQRLRETGVFLTDIRGQGFSDLVTPTGFYDNDGRGFGSFQPFTRRPAVDLEDPSVRVTDVDGDGVPDVLQIEDGVIRTYRNRGDGGGWEASTSRPVPERRFPQLTEPMVRLVDFSGDGLADLVRIHRGMLEVWPSLGNGEFGPMREILLPEPLPAKIRPADVQLVDVTGTGAADLVVREDARVRVYANGTGESFLSPVGIRVHGVASPESMQPADLLGTGVKGLLFSAATGHWLYYALWEGEKPDGLASIDNGMGGRTTVAYGSSVAHAQRDRRDGRPWRFPLPYPVRVVDEVRSLDTTTGYAVGTRYRYHEGYHDPVEREYRGFGIVEQLDTPTLHGDSQPASNARTVTFFALGNGWRFRDRYTPVPAPTPSDHVPSRPGARRALRGRVLRVELYGDDGTAYAGRPYLVNHSAFTVRTVVPPSATHPGSFDAISHLSEAFHLERGSEVRRLRTENTFDRYGRITESRQKGFGRTFDTLPTQPHLLAQMQDLERVTRTTYLTRDTPEPTDYDGPYTPAWLLDAPHEVSTYGVDGSTETLLSRSRTFYDGPTYQGLGYPGSGTEPAVVRGLVTCQLVRCASTADLAAALPFTGASDALTDRGAYLELDGAYWTHAQRVSYSPRGMPKGALDPRGNETTLGYEATHALFPTSASDPLINPTFLQRGPLPHQVVSTIDANENTTSMVYDPRNLLVARSVQGKETSPGVWSGDAPAAPTEQITYDLDAVPVHVTVQTRQVKDGATVTVHRYLDGRGRTIQERHQAEPDPDTHATRWRVSGWQVLDAKGNVVTAYQPTFGDTSAYAPGDTTVAAVTTTYDPLSRPVRVTHPDDTFESITYGTWSKQARDRNDNAGLVELSGDPRYAGNEALWAGHLDTPTTTYGDAFGRDIAIEAHNGFEQGSPILHLTRSVLDLRDRVLEVYDARGLATPTWTFSYDDCANRWTADNPTGAGIRYTLNDADGNPIWSRDARGIEIDRTFDPLGRLLTEHSDDGTTVTLRRQWTYAPTWDLLSGQYAERVSKNLWGRLEEQRDADGLRVFTYEHRGLVTDIEHRFWDHPWQAGTDPMWAQGQAWETPIPNTPRDQVPSFLELTHLPGNPTAVHISTTYDAAGRPGTVTYPGGTALRSTYNPAGALDAIELDRADGSGFASIASDYRYDFRGKLVRYTHGNGAVTTRELDPHLERLTRVFTRIPGGDLFQDLSYAYDPHGNILEVLDALTNPTYANNMVIPNTRTFEYDPRYRLTRARGRKLVAVGSKTVNPYAPAPAAQDYEAYDYTYAYDPVGNFTHNPEYGGAVAYQPAFPDRFAGDTAESAVPSNFTYDANGNTTHTPRHAALAYTFDSQPRFADMGGGGQVHWLRHGDQRCVRFADKGGVKTLTIYLGPWEYHRRTGTHARTKVELHISGAQKHAQMEDLLDGTDPDSLPLFYVHGDHLGSGHVLTKPDGTLLSQEEYLPYGRSSDRRDARNRYRYIGVERDADVHLCMTGPRTYDPLTGRFLQADPVVQPGHGTFVYASANPVGRLDPGGRQDQTVSIPPQYYPSIEYQLGRFFGKIEEFLIGGRLDPDHQQQGIPLSLPEGGLGGVVGGTAETVTLRQLDLLERNPSLLSQAGMTTGEQSVPFASPTMRLWSGTDVLGNPVSRWDAGSTLLFDSLSLGAGLSFKPRMGFGPASGASKGTETIFRVQGGVLPNASKVRFALDDAGNVAIHGDDMLFVNLGQEGRALEFLAKRGDQAELVRFEVTAEFAERLRSQAVPQRLGRQFPGRPQAVDATRAADQFGIPSEMFDDLMNNIVPGTFSSGRP